VTRKHARDETTNALPDINVGLAERAPSIDRMAQRQIQGFPVGSRSLDDEEGRSAAWAANFLLSLSPGATPPTMSPCQSRMASQDMSLQDLSLHEDGWVVRDDPPTGVPSRSSSVATDMWNKRQRLSHDE
jgi:hypothetical protein